jgi:hypothetical protein
MLRGDDQITAADPAIARKAGRVIRLAHQNDWPAVLELTADENILKSHFRLPLLRIMAALVCGDAQAAGSTVRFLVESGGLPTIRVAAASRLITAGYAELGWSLIADLDDLDAHPSLPVLLDRIAGKSAVNEIIRLATARYQKLIARRNALNWTPQPSSGAGAEAGAPGRGLPEPTFRKHGVATPTERFELIVQRSHEVAQSHVETLTTMMASFEETIKSRRAPQVREYRDVFVSRVGQIWRSDGSVLFGSALLPARPPSPWPEFDEAVLCASGTKGFYHWFAEKLPSLAWRLEPGAPRIPILIPNHAAPFQDETLRLLGAGAAEVTRIGDVAYCDRLYVAHLSVADLADWSRFGSMYGRLITAAAAEASLEQFHESIYVSRRDSPRRALSNEPDLEAALEGLGISVIRFSEHTLARQIVMAHHARLMIGLHGAGLSHVLNMKAGSSILEIVPNQDGYHSQRFNFARLSRVRHHRHTLWLNTINPVNQQWATDVPKIAALAESILRRQSQQ